MFSVRKITNLLALGIFLRSSAVTANLKQRNRLADRAVRKRHVRLPLDAQTQRGKRLKELLPSHASWISDQGRPAIAERRTDRLGDQTAIRPLIKHVRCDDDIKFLELRSESSPIKYEAHGRRC